MASNDKLVDMINDFDSSEPLAAGYSSANLSNISKKLNEKDDVHQGRSNVQIPPKIKSLVKIINKCVRDINANLLKKYPNAMPFNVEKNISYNAYGATGKIELISSNDANHLSFNIKKLSRLPALEVYAVITKAVVDVISKNNSEINDKEFVENILNVKTNSDENKVEKNDDFSKAEAVIARYLRSYLPSVYLDDFKKFNNISVYIAKLIVEEMGEKDIAKILNPFFDLSLLNIEELANEKVDAFLGRSRITRLYGKASELAEDPSKEVLSLGFEQQAQSLIGTDSTDPNYGNVAKKFEAIGEIGERCLTSVAVKEFCVYYVSNFLHAHNVKNINVTFEPKGALGSYHDLGKEQSININLKKLQKIGSFTELAMTLSHELTHAVDSTRNKTQGVYNEFGGGLINDMDNDISGAEATGKVKELLVKLKKLCYHINPNERHARIGELSALAFMKHVGANDEQIQKEIEVSVGKYLKYQQTTIDMITALPTYIEECDSEKMKLIASGELIEGSIAYRMISERIDYLKENQKGISFEEEVQSKESAVAIMEGKVDLSQNMSAQVKRDEEEQARKLAEKLAEEQELEQMQRI